MALTREDMAAALRRAGWPEALIPTMVAIGLAESEGGDPNAHCLNCAGVSEDSRGLWQINVNAHPEFRNANLYDPDTNARAALAVYNKQGLKAWSTYTSGAFRKFMQAGATAIADVSRFFTGEVQNPDLRRHVIFAVALLLLSVAVFGMIGRG